MPPKKKKPGVNVMYIDPRRYDQMMARFDLLKKINNFAISNPDVVNEWNMKNTLKNLGKNLDDIGNYFKNNILYDTENGKHGILQITDNDALIFAEYEKMLYTDEYNKLTGRYVYRDELKPKKIENVIDILPDNDIMDIILIYYYLKRIRSK